MPENQAPPSHTKRSSGQESANSAHHCQQSLWIRFLTVVVLCTLAGDWFHTPRDGTTKRFKRTGTETLTVSRTKRNRGWKRKKRYRPRNKKSGCYPAKILSRELAWVWQLDCARIAGPAVIFSIHLTDRLGLPTYFACRLIVIAFAPALFADHILRILIIAIMWFLSFADFAAWLVFAFVVAECSVDAVKCSFELRSGFLIFIDDNPTGSVV